VPSLEQIVRSSFFVKNNKNCLANISVYGHGHFALVFSAVHGTCVNNGAYFKLLEACRIQLSSLSHGTPDVNGRSRHHSFCRLLASHHREEGEEEEERDNLERVTLWHKT
jgi:hypothetical protein